MAASTEASLQELSARPSSKGSSLSNKVPRHQKRISGGHSRSLSQLGSCFFDGSVESLAFLCTTWPGSSEAGLAFASTASSPSKHASPHLGSPRDIHASPRVASQAIEATVAQRRVHPMLQPKPTESQLLRKSWSNLPKAGQERSHSSTAAAESSPRSLYEDAESWLYPLSSGQKRSWGGHYPKALLPKIQEKGWVKKKLKEPEVEEVPRGKSWQQQQKELLLQGSPFSSQSLERDRMHEDRCRLFDLLHQKGVQQGVEALRVALCWRCGSIKKAYNLFDIKGSNDPKKPYKGATFLEFVGGISLLGLDIPSLCGMREQELFEKMDLDGDRLLSLQDLEGKSKPGTANSSGSQPPLEAQDLAALAEELDMWTKVTKFTVLSAWFLTPDNLQRRFRKGTAASEQSPSEEELQGVARRSRSKQFMDDPSYLATTRAEQAAGRSIEALQEVMTHAQSAGKAIIDTGRAPATHMTSAPNVKVKVGADKPPPPPPPEVNRKAKATASEDSESQGTMELDKPLLSGGVAFSFRTAAAGGHLARASNFNLTHQPLDDVRKCWSPFAHDLAVAAKAVQRLIDKHSSMQQAGEPVLTRTDFFNFLGGDLPPRACCRHTALARLSPNLVGDMYDRFLAQQVQATLTIDQGPINRGLTFESLWDILYEVALLVGLHFRHIVEDAQEARRQHSEAVQPRTLKPAITSTLSRVSEDKPLSAA